MVDMVELGPVEAKIIKQVEYYFSDLNLSRDRFMKEVIAENDGCTLFFCIFLTGISLETMLKFNRLKCLSEDVDVIKKALLKSTSGLLEVGPNGVRRNPSSKVPDSFDAIFSAYKDRSVYVKGFATDATLDEIIEWLETVGGKTLNVHMRRLPKDKKFKGSIFAVFEKKEDAEKFLSCSDAATYNGSSMTRMYREDYWNGKKEEKSAKMEARVLKTTAAEAERDEKVASRMSVGSLLELSGLPKIDKDQTSTSENGKKEPSDDTNASEDVPVENGQQTSEGLTVLALKQWLIDKLGPDHPVAWIDVEPAEGKAIVRFKLANAAEPALTKLQAAFGEGKPIIYASCPLSGRVLSGDEEVAQWKIIFDAQLHKAQKRRGGRQTGRGFGNKRRRMN
ncbi:hypothetical protein P879_09688 [Paragonimus westermani]|uniref:Lupus La protein n=1 Tax=Paragonimus westermani TaxID=34504 RepID=A0A8T0DJ80_9TREM|nr:hypothetical protein P879_09688 [Paragonimus westermani]